jgi:hypothetical protein
MPKHLPVPRHRAAIALAFCATLVTACGGGGGSPTDRAAIEPPVDSPSLKSLSGVAVDGYLQGALVFLDLDRSGSHDAGEPSTTTGPDGSYTLDYSAITTEVSGLPIVVTGGVDSDTGFAFIGKLSAPVDLARSAQVVTPLTTLVDAMVAEGLSSDVTSARQKVAEALGLSVEQIATDPVAAIATEPAIYTKTVAIQRSVQMLARANARSDEASHETHARVVKALARAIRSQVGPVDVEKIVGSVELSKSQAAQQLASAITRTVEAGVEHKGHEGAKTALKAMDEIRTKMESKMDSDDSYELEDAAREIDEEKGESKSQPYTRIIQSAKPKAEEIEAVSHVTGMVKPTVRQPTNTSGRLLASNCYQCHGTDGRGGFDDIRGKEAAEIREYLTEAPGSSIMAAHAQGYTAAQIDSIVQYLKQFPSN